MIPDTDRASLVAAMSLFDQEYRGRIKEWVNWERHPHRWVIEHRGQRYPVKKVISLATGAPEKSFHSGEGAGFANEFLRDLGFEVVPIGRAAEKRERNPDWTRDELILALDLYFSHRRSLPGPRSDAVKRLSETLHRLGVYLNANRSETFRNPNGVSMKLQNFRRHDPEFPNSGGLPRGNKSEADIWNEFAHDRAKLSRAVETIINALNALEAGEAENAGYDEEETVEAQEGKAVTRLHVSRERSRKIVKRKKDSVLKKSGKLQCEACGFDFRNVYGERGEGFIECHHVKPVHELKPGQKTRLADLRLLCANCHRMVHARRPWLTMEQLVALAAD